MKRLRTEERILKKAFKIFARKGYEGARVEEISRAAGVNKATLYYYFKGKRDIYREVLYREFSAFIKRVAGELVSGEDISSKVEGVVEALFGLYKENPDLFRLFLREVASGGRFLREALERVREENEFIKSGGAPAQFARFVKGAERIDLVNLWLNIIGMSMIHFISEPFIEVFYSMKLDPAFLESRKKSIVLFVKRFLNEG